MLEVGFAIRQGSQRGGKSAGLLRALLQFQALVVEFGVL
jgi:hypothetical protein